jgi:glutamyl-tRNA reductase
MHQIGVVGLSYRHAGVDAVARLAVPRAEVPARLPALRKELKAAEILYVGTCNRVEVVYATGDGSPAGDARNEVFRILTGYDPAPGEAARLLRAWTGEAAVEHLFLLACGLDSAQTGEQEIAAQLRSAWQEARSAHTCGPVLDRLLGEALAMARQVRRLSAGVQAPSLADLAAERTRQHRAHRRITHDAPLRTAVARGAAAARHRQPQRGRRQRAGADGGGGGARARAFLR